MKLSEFLFIHKLFLAIVADERLPDYEFSMTDKEQEDYFNSIRVAPGTERKDVFIARFNGRRYLPRHETKTDHATTATSTDARPGTVAGTAAVPSTGDLTATESVKDAKDDKYDMLMLRKFYTCRDCKALHRNDQPRWECVVEEPMMESVCLNCTGKRVADEVLTHFVATQSVCDFELKLLLLGGTGTAIPLLEATDASG